MGKYTSISSQAGLAVIGQVLQARQLWSVVEGQVRIEQKVIQHRPTDKLLDLFITILAGGRGVVDVNRRLQGKADLQRAFGRRECADQSTISDTLRACTATQVGQWRQALGQVLRTWGQAYHHNYAANWQVLDVDLTGLPAGAQAEGATKGYFGDQPHKRGRQLGRVLASRYDEIVFEQLYEGRRQLESSLPALIAGAETSLELTPAQRARTVVRMDGGGGTDPNLDWLLARGYGVLAKVHNWKRAAKLASQVSDWRPDPGGKQREVGWVPTPHTYVQPTRQLAVRWPHPTKPHDWQYTILVTNLSDEALASLSGRRSARRADDPPNRWALLAAYDLRGGGIETSNRGSKEGLHIHQRNTRSFAAQQILLLLAELAYNLLVWIRAQLQAFAPKASLLGLYRLQVDVLATQGRIRWSPSGQVVRITLDPGQPWAMALRDTYRALLASHDTALILGQI